jgi:hypothetical protein
MMAMAAIATKIPYDTMRTDAASSAEICALAKPLSEM